MGTMYKNLGPPLDNTNFYTWCHFPLDASLFDSIFGHAPHTPPTPDDRKAPKSTSRTPPEHLSGTSRAPPGHLPGTSRAPPSHLSGTSRAPLGHLPGTSRAPPGLVPRTRALLRHRI